LIRLKDADASVDPPSSSSSFLVAAVEDAAVVLALVFFRLVVVARAADGWRNASVEVADPMTMDRKITALMTAIFIVEEVGLRLSTRRWMFLSSNEEEYYRSMTCTSLLQYPTPLIK
jgi:hypothetical protein